MACKHASGTCSIGASPGAFYATRHDVDVAGPARRDSLLSLASTPPMTGYSASKAAAHSLTQALRPALATKGITVHGVYPGGIDTDMLAGIDAPKMPAAEVAAGILPD